MATTLNTLIQQTRRKLRDWKDFDTITASLSASTTSLAFSDTSIYAKRWPIEIDQETMVIRSVDTSTQLTVERGAFGSTVATHTSGTQVLIRPDFYTVEIVDAINQGIQACFPDVYRPVVDTSLTVLANQYQYVIPDMPSYTGYPIPRIYRVELLQPGDYKYRETKRWELQRGFVTAGSPASSGGVASTHPIIQFKSLPPVGSVIRISGFGPFPALAATSDTLDALWPPMANYILPLYAAGSMLMSGEAGRVRVDGTSVDTREQANRVGSSMAAGQSLIQQWRRELLTCAMPPLPKHVKTVI